ncbi:MAG: type II toxin-antitoxin system HigB family toxin [Spirochaetales bacterium]|jgi:mRNA interferase HigB|nr:type II toxin-antitoxin system HigB family toxin [Spirochaetales bacterium]
MRIITLRTLKQFWLKKPDAEKTLKAWHAEAKAADWQSPTEIKAQYRSASILQDSRVVFNICGNKYRLIVKINYHFSIIYIRFIGTHKKYDTINAEEI